jgi:hypothetical protein
MINLAHIQTKVYEKHNTDLEQEGKVLEERKHLLCLIAQTREIFNNLLLERQLLVQGFSHIRL